MRPARWTEQYAETLRELREAGKTFTAISEATGFSTQHLTAKAKALGLTPSASRPRHGAGWTEARVEKLKELSAEGLSCSQIAEILGGVTRNAVIGKLLRLKIRHIGHSSGEHKSRVSTRANKKRRAAAKKSRRATPLSVTPLPPAPLPMPESAPPNATPFVDLKNNQCRWAYGEDNFVFCPETKLVGFSYCAGHCARVYRPVPAPERRQ